MVSSVKRVLIVGLFLTSFIGTILLLLYINQDKFYPEMSLSGLNELEQNWYAAGIDSYDLTIEVQFFEERRLHHLKVRGGLVEAAFLRLWDAKSGEWGKNEVMSAENAYWFTLPGLFQTIRQEIQNDMRQYIRSEVNNDPVYPKVIIFGPLMMPEGGFNKGTNVKITIIEFTQWP